MSSINDIVCPKDCSISLPVFDFSDCSPKVKTGQIIKAYLGKTSFTDVTSGAEWNTRLPGNEEDQNETSSTALRVLTIIGDLPAPEKTVKEISGGRTVSPTKKFTVNWIIDDVSDANYNAFRALNCPSTYKMWFEDNNGYIFGGDEGISVSIDGDLIIPQSKDDLQSLTGTFKWTAQFPPVSSAKPF